MQTTREDIDLATRGELENMMALNGLPYTHLTYIFGYRDKYSSLLKLILRAMNCLKLVAQKKELKLNICAFVELPVNFEELELYKRWDHFKRMNIGYSKDFEIDELRNFYSIIEKSDNFLIEGLIDRGESTDFIREWKGILAKCATSHPGSSNQFKVIEAKDPLSIAVKPFQVLRGSRLIKINRLNDYKELKPNGRFEMNKYMHISEIDNIIRFIEGSFKPVTRSQ